VLQKDPCSEFNYSSPRDNCGLIGALRRRRATRRRRAAGGFAGRAARRCGGVSILKPRELGGITAYDMNTGDKKWWIPNGGWVPVTSNDPLFAGVTLPPRSGGGQAQVITTKTLVIYGTGRSGGVPGPSRSSSRWTRPPASRWAPWRSPAARRRVPMTFMHKGKQYIVFATGAGSSTSLVALRLP
jgi:hypothetical protein